MNRGWPSKCLGVLLFWALADAAGLAQDFHKTYLISAGGQIRIRNISGNVRVQGYNGENIIVDGYKVGRDKDLVSVVDDSGGNSIDVHLRYPQHGPSNASVNFDVKVPQSVEYNFEEVSSISGNVSVQDVKGRMRARSISGNVDVKGMSGLVSAESTSGNVYVEITNVSGSGEMKFWSISGDVSVKAPKSLNADVEMQTISGSLRTDFPIEVHEPRYGPGRSARGRIGNGSNNIRINSVSGRVSLVQY